MSHSKEPDRHSAGSDPVPVPVATYRRRMPVSLDRMLENALDWEHLPWLHSSSFASIELVDEDEWHWRADTELAGAGGSQQFELRLHDDRLGWTTSTLAGSGAGSSIFTRVLVHGEHEIEVVVDFFVPGIEAEADRKAVGEFYLEVYRQLYDEDESMMVERQRRLDSSSNGNATARNRRVATTAEQINPAPIDLGPTEQLAERLPIVIDTDAGRFRVLTHDGHLLAHSVLCPHRLGPLDQCKLISPGDGNGGSAPEIVCPWHGYRFDASSGRSTDGQRHRLAPAPAVETGNDGRARLVWPANQGKTL